MHQDTANVKSTPLEIGRKPQHGEDILEIEKKVKAGSENISGAEAAVARTTDMRQLLRLEAIDTDIDDQLDSPFRTTKTSVSGAPLSPGSFLRQRAFHAKRPKTAPVKALKKRGKGSLSQFYSMKSIQYHNYIRNQRVLLKLWSNAKVILLAFYQLLFLKRIILFQFRLLDRII